MSKSGTVQSALDAELHCSNCGRYLDASDKFCRDCGLPTIRRGHIQQTAANTPPDTKEFKRAMDVAADPAPFMHAPPWAGDGAPELTPGGVLRVTSPTFATRLAGTTLLMVGLIFFLVGLGVRLLVLAFK